MEHESIVILDGIWWDTDPIRVAVGTDTPNLPDDAVAQITQDDHVFHNPNSDQWPTCPQVVPPDNIGGLYGSGEPPQNCNQVYRQPYIDTGSGTINMRTRGTGTNKWDPVNQYFGKGIFDDLDQEMIDAILAAADHLCPALSPL